MRLAGSLEQELDRLFKNLLEWDKKRQQDALAGRRADEVMMALCQFLKDRRKELPEARFKKSVETIRQMNLRPYWNYCREHLLDIGLEF